MAKMGDQVQQDERPEGKGFVQNILLAHLCMHVEGEQIISRADKSCLVVDKILPTASCRGLLMLVAVVCVSTDHG